MTAGAPGRDGPFVPGTGPSPSASSPDTGVRAPGTGFPPGTASPPGTGFPPATGSLASRQAELVAALVAGGPEPDGFDPHRLAATRAALLRKRAGLAAAAWPLLAAGLGTDWQRVFADRFSGVAPYGPEAEGLDLARELATAGRLGPGAARELAAHDAAASAGGPITRWRRWWAGRVGSHR